MSGDVEGGRRVESTRSVAEPQLECWTKIDSSQLLGSMNIECVVFVKSKYRVN